jgi:hypothetical protein
VVGHCTALLIRERLITKFEEHEEHEETLVQDENTFVSVSFVFRDEPAQTGTGAAV